MRQEKTRLLRASFAQSFARVAGEVDAFFASQSDHLRNYAAFAALKERFGGLMWTQWPREARDFSRLNPALLGEEFDFHRYCQWLFFRQWRALRDYARERGVLLFGDMPIYVAQDSADVWEAPELFQLDGDYAPTRVAGVPPDYFCEDGQRWGNPLYNWKKMKRTGFSWWLDRLRAAGAMFDILRIDHFIGFANYYSIPASCPTAREGKWVKAPGRALFRRVARQLPELRIVAEDLGEVGSRVKRLIRRCGFPGMRVLVFGFDSDEKNPHYPANLEQNCVVYTGTHDNDTVMGWWEAASEPVKALAMRTLAQTDDVCDAMIECAFASKAETAIVPMQDVLHLGNEARMNHPGTVGGNWLWRMRPGAADEALSRRLLALARQTNRLAPA